MITWAPDARPADAQIGAVLDEFEKTAWASLEPDRYAWTPKPQAGRRWFERLDGQVTGLPRDYGTLAETLRERWR